MSPASPADRMMSAEIRAIDAHKSVRRRAEHILEELGDLTDPGAFPNVEIHEEDSAVIVLQTAFEQHSSVVTTRGAEEPTKRVSTNGGRY